MKEKEELYRLIVTACILGEPDAREIIYIRRIAQFLWKDGYKAEEWEIILQTIFNGPDYIEQAVKEWGIRQ